MRPAPMPSALLCLGALLAPAQPAPEATNRRVLRGIDLSTRDVDAAVTECAPGVEAAPCHCVRSRSAATRPPPPFSTAVATRAAITDGMPPCVWAAFVLTGPPERTASPRRRA